MATPLGFSTRPTHSLAADPQTNMSARFFARPGRRMASIFGAPPFLCLDFDRDHGGAVTAIGVARFPAPAVRGDLLEVVPGSRYADCAARWRVLGLFATGRILVAWDAASVLRTLEAELDGNPSATAWRRIYDLRSLAAETWPEIKSSSLEELVKERGVEIKDPRAHGRAMATMELFAQVAEIWDENPPEWGARRRSR